MKRDAVGAFLPVGWITPGGDWVGAPRPHIKVFLDGKLPIPPELEGVNLRDDIPSVTRIVEFGNYIRVSQGNFQSRDLSQGCLGRIESHLLDFGKKYKEASSPHTPYWIDPVLSSGSIHMGIAFSWDDFEENDFRIPKPHWYNLSRPNELTKGGYRSMAGRVVMLARSASVRREALRQIQLKYLFLPESQAGILSAEKKELKTGENKRRSEDLVRDILKMGYRYTTAKGIYDLSPERSFLVWNIPLEKAVHLQVAYDQESIIHKAHGESRPWYYDRIKGVKYPSVKLLLGTEEGVPLEDRTQIRKDPTQHFRIEFDWDSPFPWAAPVVPAVPRAIEEHKSLSAPKPLREVESEVEGVQEYS